MLAFVVTVVTTTLSVARVTCALNAAARNGDMGQLTNIVQSVGSQTLNLEPAFHEASSHGRINAMKYLIAQGADDFNGALVRASINNQIRAVRYLVEHDQSVVDLDLRLARLAAGSAGATEAEFMIVTHILHG